MGSSFEGLPPLLHRRSAEGSSGQDLGDPQGVCEWEIGLEAIKRVRRAPDQRAVLYGADGTGNDVSLGQGLGDPQGPLLMRIE